MLILTILLALFSALISATPTPQLRNTTDIVPQLLHLPDTSIPGETAGNVQLQDGGYFVLYAEYAPGYWDQFKSPIKQYWIKMGHVHCDFHSAWPPSESNLVYRTTTSGDRNEGPNPMNCCAVYYSCQKPPPLPEIE
ncbi:hypothetical protein BDV96DRAFT_641851 [Lophiotrema nucula]|uniref:Uncharacterized protein n=1 Tax=Lophiotrema nucula TaxID=690887 RepID=A0A6A5ZL32_9PLEO|nr:hypothetical protein BDV96DRAFT_641851 [Lophiotrema nucula]